MVVVTGVGSQPALGAWLTAVPCLMEPCDPHRERLKQLFDDVAVSVVEVTAQIGLWEGGEIAHAVDEKLRVGDPVFLFPIRGEATSLGRFRGVQKVVRGARLSNRHRSPHTATFRVLRPAEPAFRRQQRDQVQR